MLKGNLLIIEDEIMLAQNLAKILEPKADIVQIAHDGINGLQIIESETIHCVISDIYMPIMTGIDVLNTVRTSGNKIPFIFFTAYAVAELKNEVSRFENTVFLVKPDIDGLIMATDQMLRLGQETLHGIIR